MPENCTLALKSRQRRRLRTNTAGYINKRIISLARQTQVRFYRLQPPCSSFRVLLIQGRIYVYIREKNKDVFRLKCLYDYQSLIKKKISIYIQINNKKKKDLINYIIYNHDVVGLIEFGSIYVISSGK